MKHIFIDPNTSLVRAGWRILLFTIVFILLNLGLSIFVRAMLGSLRGGSLISFFILGVTATISAFFTRKYLEKDSISTLGISFNMLAIKDLLIGICISAVVMSGMYALLYSLGLIQFEGFSWWLESTENSGFTSESLIIFFGVFIQFSIVAWWEELAFRGIVLQNICKGLNLTWGVVLSILFFGLIHAGNPGSTVLSTVLIMLISTKLVYAYLKTEQLWLPIGLHLGWNFFQSSLFGFSSSGHSSPSLIKQMPLGLDWLSGGEFGVENSVLIIPFVPITWILIHVWVNRSRKIPEQKCYPKNLQQFVPSIPPIH
ncbi:type II CAAX endopeptidase family protein [Algoriphagus sp. SE2]|uniref:CPBP family intramembrane glutamic endopeptidase n=1 Tax=Algoriphagus sp. SE2 TaxID=3141536 RepID=UPI0031CD5993